MGHAHSLAAPGVPVTHPCHAGRVPVPATSLAFAAAARRLAVACRSLGLVAPSYRSPPGHPSAIRTIRRQPDGGAVVAVRVRGRDQADVEADMVEGVIVLNRLSGAAADEVRARLLGDLDVAPPARAA